MDRTATKQIDFSRPPHDRKGPKGRRGVGRTGAGGRGGGSMRSIQVFRMRNSRVALHRHFHFRVKLGNTGVHTPLHTARAERHARIIPYRRFGELRTPARLQLSKLNIIKPAATTESRFGGGGRGSAATATRVPFVVGAVSRKTCATSFSIYALLPPTYRAYGTRR